ncbi:hypothetical protein D3C72_1763860 [compost metagenome]
MTPSNRRHYAITVEQAASEAPTLASLAALTRESTTRYKLVEFLVPPMLRPAIKPGPIDGDQWCLLVANNACAAKLKQLVPAMAAHLRVKGYPTADIRLKVLGQGTNRPSNYY